DGWYVTGPDGQKGIYGFYPARGNGCITYVSAAWAKKAGYESEDSLPANWAEYQEFLQKMKEANEDQAPVLAAGGLFNAEAPYTNYLPEFWQDAYPDFYFDEAKGEWVDGFTTDAMAAALDRIQWGYENGYLNAAILEGPSTSDVRNKYFYAGKTGVFTYWAGTWAYNNITNLAKNELDTECWELKPIAEMGAYLERMSPMICITSNCKNPEGVFKYFIDTMLDGDKVQMLWQYGVEGVHYEWNEDHTKINGLVTESSKGSEKESKTTKNLFEANLKLANFAGVDPYTPQDPVIDKSFNLFNDYSKAAPALISSDLYTEYSSTLWTEKKELAAKVAQGEMSGAEAVAKYIEDCGTISTTVIASFK
ncbi:MAG: ABC transporter substrate-binding protein, partial [Lachnospiraceae bacterium]|nr:ABC transporter substrate-binding protein [Lachnospiraceae bacterium]